MSNGNDILKSLKGLDKNNPAVKKALEQAKLISKVEKESEKKKKRIIYNENKK